VDEVQTMNETNLSCFEELLWEKIALYGRLRDCFLRERQCLISMEVDQLWALSDEKRQLCSRIESLREKILHQLKPDTKQESLDVNQIIRELPRERRSGFRNLHLRLVEIKAEIKNLRRDNKAFIEHSLEFLDEMLSILTGEAMTQSLYDRSSTIRPMESRIHLSSEA
jgi:FlgN protein